MKSLRLLFSSGRSLAPAALLLAASLCFKMPAAHADATVVVLDTGIDTATSLNFPPAPRTFVGSPFALGSAAGTTNIPINGGTLYLATTTATNYTALQATIYFWGTVNPGAVTAAAPAYSNPLGTITLNVGALTSRANGIEGYDFTLANPITIPTRTLGVTVAWKGNSGAGLVSTDALTSVIRSGPAFPVGAHLFGNGFYFNSNGETNGNFTTGLRGFTGLTNQAITIDLTAFVPTPVLGSFSPSSGSAGTSVVINGTGFGGATSVSFNGISTAAFTVNSQTQITATVPAGATSGPITVTTAGGTVTSTDSFTVLAPPANSAQQGAIISEFRLGGPGDNATASDEFIEIYNQGNTPLDLTGWSVSTKSLGITISSGKVIKPYGRLLLTGNGYSLSNLGGTGAATGDVPYVGDIALGSTLTLNNALGSPVDVVASSSLPSPLAATDNYSYVRRMDGAGGAPLDTGTDTTDFNLVDVQSTVGPDNTTGVSSGLLRLGAPGPQNLASPIAANQLIKFIQTSVARSSTNNNILIVRGTVQNVGTSALTAMRFRAVGLTAGTAATSTTAADVRLTSSTSADGINLPLSLQTPPTQPNGGGLNATVSLSGLPTGGLAAGATVTVEFAFTIVKAGTFRYLLNLEPVATP